MALVGKNSEKNNQNLMQLIRRAHGLVENPDLEKHRQSQDHICLLYTSVLYFSETTKAATFRSPPCDAERGT